MSQASAVVSDPGDPVASSQRRMPVFVPVMLLVACLLSYASAYKGQFIWDDDYYVVNNTALRSFDGLQAIWLGVFPDPSRYVAPQYYPMTFTSLWLDYRIWGLNPVGYHLTNVLLHALSAWVVYVLLRRLAVPGAFLASLIFALHPVHAESVAWITERKNVLSGLFYLLSMLVYLRFIGLDRSPHAPAAVKPVEPQETKSAEYKLEMPAEPWKVYSLALLLFAVALLSKSVTATLPAAVLLIIWWKRGRIESRDFVPLVPFFVLGLLMSGVTSHIERNVVGAVGAEWSYTGIERLLIASRAACFYVGKLLLPTNLMFMYPKWEVDPAQGWQWIFPGVVIFGVVLGVLGRKRFGNGPLTAILFYLGTLLPALGFFNFFPMRYSFVADHYVYLASLGIIVPVAVVLTMVVRPLPARIVGAIAVAALLGLLTFRQAGIYEGPETLWTKTIERNPASWMAHNNLGRLYLMRGDVGRAETYLLAATDLRKDNPEAHTNLGMLAVKKGDLKLAEEHYRFAIEANARRHESDKQVAGDPRLPPRRAYAIPYINLGSLRQLQNNTELAIKNYRAALMVDDRNAVAQAALGQLLYRSSLTEPAEEKRRQLLGESLELLSQAVDADPTKAGTRLELANVLRALGQFEQAAVQWQLAGQQDPNNPKVYQIGGLIAADMGNWQQAVKWYQKAVELAPESSEAREQLEKARQRAATQPSAVPTTGPRASMDASSQIQQTLRENGLRAEVFPAPTTRPGTNWRGVRGLAVCVL